MGAGGQIQPRVRVLHRPSRADLDPADRVHRLHEAGEVDLQIVVDLDLGHVLDGPHGQGRPTLRVRRVQLHRVALVAFARGAVGVGGHLGVTVAGEADHARPPPVGRQMDQHDRVGAVAGRAAQPVLLLLLLGDRVPAVGADEQQVRAVAPLRTVLHVLERIDPADPVLQAAHQSVADPARPQHQHRETDGHPHAPARALVLLPGAHRPRALRRTAARGSGTGLRRALRTLRHGHGGDTSGAQGRHLCGARGPSHVRPIRSPPRPATRRHAPLSPVRGNAAAES